ncbi:MAG: hypothetical protein ACLQMS_05570, partial [Desulfomonilaceae bacterium]
VNPPRLGATRSLCLTFTVSTVNIPSGCLMLTHSATGDIMIWTRISHLYDVAGSRELPMDLAHASGGGRGRR